MKRSIPSRRWRSEEDRHVYFVNREARRRTARDTCEARWHPRCPALIEDPRERATADTTTWHHAHHVHERRFEGSDDHDNLRWVCEWCHNRIHARRLEAIERGLLIDRRSL